MGEGNDEETGQDQLKAQILDFLDRWPSKYPSPVKIAAATGRSPKEVIDEMARIRASGEWPALPEHFPAPPPRPDEEPSADDGVRAEQPAVPPPARPAWDRSN
jgi:hypothetical protein